MRAHARAAAPAPVPPPRCALNAADPDAACAAPPPRVRFAARAQLQRSGARVLYGVDATAVDSCASLCEWRSACRFVVFNFPHAGAGIKDERQNAEHHRRLIRRTLRAARAMLAPRTSTAGAGEAHVTLRRGRPYSQWGVPSLADGLLGLRFAREVPFDPALYPGYEHRRTRGLAASRPDAAESWQPNSAVAKGEGSVTYCFERREQAEHEQRAERLSPGGGGGGGTV